MPDDHDRRRRERERDDDTDWAPLPKKFPRPGEREPRTFTEANICAGRDWLRFTLRYGPMPAQTVLKLADDCEVPRALIALAKKRLGVVLTDANATVPGETFKAWMWRLPHRGGLFDDDEG